MDSKKILTEYLKKNSSLTIDEIELICTYFQEEYIKNETLLVNAGSKYKRIVFVVEGILRVYIVDNKGEEVVKNFIEPNSFFAGIESIEKNQPALISVSAVTDCCLLILSKSDSDALVSQLPQWEYLIKAGAMQAMNDMIRKQNFLRIGDSSEQYQFFVKNFPLLAQQVPLKYIASYLRITQSSLSRIRHQSE